MNEQGTAQGVEQTSQESAEEDGDKKLKSLWYNVFEPIKQDIPTKLIY